LIMKILESMKFPKRDEKLFKKTTEQFIVFIEIIVFEEDTHRLA